MLNLSHSLNAIGQELTHMPLPPKEPHHGILLADIPSGKEQCMC